MCSIKDQIVAKRIRKVLQYLKKNKINQSAIEQRLNYTSLSKAKNYERYPQNIIERKSRTELLDLLLDEYGLEYIDETDRVVPKGAEIRTSGKNNVLYYVMYYYAFTRNVVDKAIVKIINKQQVIIDYRLDEHWEGVYNIIENYTFIQLEKMGGTTPVKKLICLFTGTKKIGRPILLGTYSTVKRDGFPAAGKILFEKIEDESQINKKIKSETDDRIAYYLSNRVFVSETFTPNTLDELDSRFKLLNRYTGDYYLLYPTPNHDIIKAKLTWSGNTKVELFFDNISYTGNAKPLDNHTIKLEMTDDAGFSELSQDSIIIFIKMVKSLTEPYYKGVGISNILESNSNSFNCLIIQKKDYNEFSEKLAKKILGSNSII